MQPGHGNPVHRGDRAAGAGRGRGGRPGVHAPQRQPGGLAGEGLGGPSEVRLPGSGCLLPPTLSPWMSLRRSKG